MSKGVAIYAFKKAAYGKLAWNLAVSIRANNPDLPVSVITDGKALGHLADWQMAYFDKVVQMSMDDLYEKEKFMPGKGKLSGYKYLPYDHTMIIDADSICIGNIGDLFEKSTGPIHSQAVGVFSAKDTTWTCQWMSLENVKEVYSLGDKFTIYEINSSFMCVRKCEESEQFYNQALSNYKTGIEAPKFRKWGGGFPDELAFNVAFAQCKINPSFADQEVLSNDSQWPIFFSTRFTNDWSYVHNNFKFIGYFGDRHFTDRSLQDQYDRLMIGYGRKFGFMHQYKMHQLMKEKHVLSK